MKPACRIFILVLGTSILASLATAQQYAVQAIKIFDGPSSAASGINNHLAIVGSAAVKSGMLSQAYLWTRGAAALDLGPPGRGSEANAINDNGEVVGCAVFPGETTFHAFLWTPSAGLQDLGTLGGSTSCARAINLSGQVVGFSTAADNSQHAFFWTQSGGMQDLGPGSANAINDSGQVTGGFPAMGGRAFLWTSARGMRELPVLPGSHAIEANGINNGGEIVGDVIFDRENGGAQHAVRWPHLLGGGVQDLGTLPGGSASAASAVNAGGEIVGGAVTSQGVGHGFLWTPTNGMQDLNDLIPSASGWVVFDGADVNDLGRIVANGTKGTSTASEALLLTPPPAAMSGVH